MLPLRLGFALFSLAAVGCASDTMPEMVQCPGPDCVCTGASCACGAGLACALDCASLDGATCGLTCGADNVCETDCGAEMCNVDCEMMANCNVDATGDTDVNCKTGSTCVVMTTGDNADLDCESGAECTFTAPGADSEVDCRADSRCVVVSGRDADVRCEGANCTVRLADEGDLTCEMAATCAATCDADCTVTCRDTSTCTVQCAGDSEPSVVDGEATCVAPG